MSNEEISFSFNFSPIIRTFIGITTGLIVVLAFKQPPLEVWWIVLGLIDGSYITSLIFKHFPLKIMIDKKLNILTIESLWCLFRREKRQYNINEITHSYKEEGSAIGIVTKTLRIRDAHGGSILELIPNYSGWSRDKLEKIFEALQPQ